MDGTEAGFCKPRFALPELKWLASQSVERVGASGVGVRVIVTKSCLDKPSLSAALLPPAEKGRDKNATSFVINFC